MTPPIITLGKRGQSLIKEYEQLRLTAYKPTPNDVWTIGWGSTRNVTSTMTITHEQAEVRFLEDIEDARKEVQKLYNKLEGRLTQSMIDALISLVFNAGPKPVYSTNTIGRELIKGDYYSAWAGFALWRKQAGMDLRGLAMRRAKEMLLFFEDSFPGSWQRV